MQPKKERNTCPEAVEDFQKGDIIRNCKSGRTGVVSEVYNNYVLVAEHQYVDNPKEWFILINSDQDAEETQERSGGWKERGNFERLVRHLVDQVDKQHFVNALTTVNEISAILLRALKALLAGRSMS
jgi:hypothetical protein